MKLNAAIIGCGRVVREGHLLGFQDAANQIKVAAIADPVAEHREYVGQQLCVPPAARFADYRALLDNVQCDFVDLALPHFLHEEAILATAQAGRHILTEKPLTTSVDSAARIAEAVQQSGVLFGVFHNYVHLPHYQALHEAISKDIIGKPFVIRFESLGGGGHWPGAAGYDPDWRTRAARSGGGALIDNGYHNLYMCERWMGDPVSKVTARTVTARGGDVEDLVFVLLDHAKGGISSAQVSWAVKASGHPIVEVHGESGSLAISDNNEVLLYRDQDASWNLYFTPERAPSFRLTYSDSLREFAAAVEQKRDPPYGLGAAVHNLAIIMAAYESAASDKAVAVESTERRIMPIKR